MIRVTIWNEFIHERTKDRPEIQRIITNAVRYLKPMNYLDKPYECVMAEG